MTELTREQQAPAMGSEQSTTAQAKEKVQETAGQMQQQVGEKAQRIRGEAAEQVRRQVDSRSTMAGEQISATADAVRRVGQQLREDGKGTPAHVADRAAEPLDRLGRYLRKADGEQILRDAEQFARRRPWVAVIGGSTLGFFAARFVKASSNGGAHALPAAGQTTPTGMTGGGHGQSRE